MKVNQLGTQCCLIGVFVFSIGIAGCAEPVSNSKTSNSNESITGNAAGTKLSASAKKLRNVQADFEHMSEFLQFDNVNQARLQKVHDQHLEKMEFWYAANGDVIAEIQGNALDAFKNKDKRKINEMNARGDKEKIAKLINEERKFVAEYKTALLNALPEPRKILWKAHVVSENLLEFLQPLDLSDAQIEEVRNLGTQAISNLKTDENWKGYGTTELEKIFERQIISQSQKPAFEELKKKNRMRMLKWSTRSARAIAGHV